MKVKMLRENARVMTSGSEYAAGLDVYACLNPGGSVSVQPGQCSMIPVGVSIEIEPGTFAGLYPRSGISTRKGLRLANCVGVIDSDYRGEVMVPLYNDSDKAQIVFDGDRIAQIIVQPFIKQEIEVVEELSDTERGSGGFGSTDRGK